MSRDVLRSCPSAGGKQVSQREDLEPRQENKRMGVAGSLLAITVIVIIVIFTLSFWFFLLRTSARCLVIDARWMETEYAPLTHAFSAEVEIRVSNPSTRDVVISDAVANLLLNGIDVGSRGFADKWYMVPAGAYMEYRATFMTSDVSDALALGEADHYDIVLRLKCEAKCGWHSALYQTTYEGPWSPMTGPPPKTTAPPSTTVPPETTSPLPTTAPPTTTPPPVKLDELFSLSARLVGGARTEFKYYKPDEGCVFYAVEVEFTNVGAQPHNVSPGDFVLETGASSYYDHHVATRAAPDRFPSIALSPGKKAKGHIIYEVKQGERPEYLIFVTSIGTIRAKIEK